MGENEKRTRQLNASYEDYKTLRKEREAAISAGIKKIKVLLSSSKEEIVFSTEYLKYLLEYIEDKMPEWKKSYEKQKP